MTTLTERKQQLPDKIEDLAKFALINRERLNAVRASIRAIEKVGIAKEVHEQKLAEAQDLAEAVLDAETKIGELTLQMEKATANQYTVQKDNTVPKQKQLAEVGITEKQKQRYEKLANHPKAVESAKAIAREEGRVVSRQDVLDLIVEPSAPKRQTMRDQLRQVDRDHMAFLMEKRMNPVVDIAAAQKDKENTETIAHNNYVRLLKALKSVNNMQFFMEEGDIDRMARSIGTDSTKSLIRSIKAQLDYLLNIYNRLVEVVK